MHVVSGENVRAAMRLSRRRLLSLLVGFLLFLWIANSIAALGQDATPLQERKGLPPRVVDAQRFLAQRGWTGHVTGAVPILRRSRNVASPMSTTGQGIGSTATWQPLGPSAVNTPHYGLVTGRVSSIAFDPADSTGNRVYLGTTGGGVWLSQNAATSNTDHVLFAPMTDALGAMSSAFDASISIGAITVQPGGTGVILAGTGDPNDALDSYYGGGILRSTDGGSTWSLIATTADQEWGFAGEGFAGFAWSTVNAQIVVAAVSQAYEGALTNAERAHSSYEGLYYSKDSGATWSLARITDGNGFDVQGPNDTFAKPDGNAVTSVVWNPMRSLFVAAVRYHGYYQSSDGVTWTRLGAQPGAALTSGACPANPGTIGSLGCPIFRGTLAVNPLTGDTFAWTVDINNQDQGIWQDKCAASGGVCSNRNLTFGNQWNTSALETNDPNLGPITIENGDYNLALSAVPSGQDTLLLAGANDLWKCSLAMNCVWRNTTNANTCMSARVAGYQHALAWSSTNPLEILLGNDGGLWRSMDAIGEAEAACDANDATHFQNLNSGLGSLAEVESMSQVGESPYTMMTGLGVNGTAGVKSTSAPTANWPQILGGEGGPVAIDPTNVSNWYVNSSAGVSIYLCSQTDDCTPAAFGSEPVVTDANVNGDGYSMGEPAPFLVDPLDASQLLIGTCRVWRGPANGSGWSSSNAISPFLDGVQGESACNGDAVLRTMAAMALPGGAEVIYVGMYGAADGGTLAGHVFGATFDPAENGMPVWHDLSLNPVTNDTAGMNAYGLDISSITIDPHDTTGNTVYVTVEGVPEPKANVRVVYRSTDGGAHWQILVSNLPLSPANSLAVDPQDANTVYIALDSGVFSTRQIGTCTGGTGNCWSAYGTGLPGAPVTQLSAAPTTASLNVLVAGTYGRGVWQIPLWTAGTQLTTAEIAPTALTFPSQAFGVASSAQTITVTNTGGIGLTVSPITASGDFSETDDCQGNAVNSGASCTIQVSFTPTQAGARTGQLAVSANVPGGQLSVSLTGTAADPAAVELSPATVNFGPVATGTSSNALQATLQNASSAAVSVTSATVSAPFVLTGNACGASVAANSDCQFLIEFAPTAAGSATGTFTVVDSAGAQTVGLSGNGTAPPTDTLSQTSLTFPGTVVGQTSAPQSVSLTNSGGVPLTSIALAASGPFQLVSNCTTQLAANSSCSVGAIFDPSAVGVQSGVLTISDLTRAQPQTIVLAGTGLAPPEVSMNPTSLSFPVQDVGVASTPLVLTISNTGGAPMANVGFQFTGISATSFSTGVMSCRVVLDNGSSCTVQVIFAPAAAGGAAASLTVSSSTLGVKPVQVPLRGAGQAVGINVSPAQMAFTVGTIGQSSAVQIATIANSSALSASGLALAISPTFSLSQNDCGTNLAAGGSCSVGVIFTPATNGATSGSLSVSSSLNAATVILSGIGGATGSVELLPALLTFPTTGVGSGSAAQTVTVTNAGPVALENLALNVSTGFQLASTTCAPLLAIGATCTAGVTFNPGTAGQQTGNLTLTSSAVGTGAQASLSGMGFDFAAVLSGSSSQTVSSGQTASFALVLTPMSGSSGTFTFACGALPAHAACSFNPASETVVASSPGNVAVEVMTGGAATSAHDAGLSRWGLAPAVAGWFLLPLAWRRRRKILMMAALFGFLVGGASSCTGSGGGSGGTATSGQGQSNTPPGTYSIPVSISSNGVVHKLTLTLTVD